MVRKHVIHVRKQAILHAISLIMKCNWRASRTRRTVCLFKLAFLCWKTLDKTACLWYYISCRWARLTTQHFLFRGIAQLVEQRSPNVNRDLIPRIITGFLRLGTSVSSLFSCFDFCKSLKWFMQNLGQNLQKILEQHQKTSNFSLGRKRMFFVSENDWMMLFRVSQTQISWLSRPSKTNLIYPSS